MAQRFNDGGQGQYGFGEALDFSAQGVETLEFTAGFFGFCDVGKVIFTCCFDM
jgi:hypothetical protein